MAALSFGGIKMKADHSHAAPLLPWLSVPIVLLAYLVHWTKLPAELIVHWTLGGRPETGFLMGRGQTLLMGIFGLLVILGLYSWKIRDSDGNNLRGTLLRYYLATGVMTMSCLGIALYNVLR